MNSENLAGFLPVELQRVGVLQPRLFWCDFTGVSLDEPFFIRDLYRRLMMPQPQLHHTPLEALLEVDGTFDSLQPSGFIFHISHCGSTLLTNMLRRGSRSLVLSEPNVLTALLRIAADGDRARGLALTRAGVHAFGQRRLGWEEHFIIKFSSFTALYLPLITELFPQVPKLFLVRRPVEVLSSNMNTPYQQWIFDESITGLDHKTITETNTVVENCAHGLRRTLQALRDYHDEHSLLVDYEQITTISGLETVLHFFNVPHDREALDAMLAAASEEAKIPGHAFEENTAHRQRTPSAKVRELATALLDPLYDELQRLQATP